MRWALVGASDIAATRVIPALRATGHDVAGVMSSSADRARSYAADHDLACWTTDLEDVRGWGVDAVYISSTNERHAQQAVWAARAGLHVLCEKPLALTVADAQAIVDAGTAHRVVVATNHHLRSSAVIRRARELVVDDTVGELRAVRMHHAVFLPERLRGWRITDAEAGGGVILDITVHDADTLRFLTGREVTTVTAVTASQAFGGPGIEDTAFCVMTLEDGAVATTHESFAVPHAFTAVEVHGSDASLYLRDVLTQDPVGQLVLRRDGVETEVEVGEREDLYVVILEAFAAAVGGTGAPTCTAGDGVASLAIALAARLSAREHRTVHLSEIIDAPGGVA
ncbi:MAG: Gfo/Idh/MocA family protein [Motilibacteraceae bacterium]